MKKVQYGVVAVLLLALMLVASSAQAAEQKLPRRSLVSNTTGRSGEAPLTIKTSGTGYYFVKFVDTKTFKSVSFFIHAGKTLNTKMPLGKYQMKYAYGQKWHGEKDLFGPETVYSASASTFDFHTTGSLINGYTVTLYSVAGGNMRTFNIPANQF